MSQNGFIVPKQGENHPSLWVATTQTLEVKKPTKNDLSEPTNLASIMHLPGVSRRDLTNIMTAIVILPKTKMDTQNDGLRTIIITIWRWFRKNVTYRTCLSRLMWYFLILWLNLLPKLWCITKRIFLRKKRSCDWSTFLDYLDVGSWDWWCGALPALLLLTIFVNVRNKVWKILLFVPRLRQSVQGRVTMAETMQCADGLEKVIPFKYGSFLGIYVRCLGPKKHGKPVKNGRSVSPMIDRTSGLHLGENFPLNPCFFGRWGVAPPTETESCFNLFLLWRSTLQGTNISPQNGILKWFSFSQGGIC